MTDEQMRLIRRTFRNMTPDEMRKASREAEIAEWRASNRFCGRCGAEMKPHANPHERALVCGKCGYMAYPKIAPAVIILVTKGDKVLLQRNTHYQGVVWSLVAGFVDPGENLEDAIRREVREEASIEVKDIRYFGSQTWPFPSNIMIGFRAEYAGGELKPDGEEVVESGWFDRDHLPEIPRPGSIARVMLDAWVAEKNGARPQRPASQDRNQDVTEKADTRSTCGETQMKITRRKLIGHVAAFTAATHAFPALAQEREKKTIKIRQIRNATLRVRFGGVEFLIDPWLAGRAEGMTFRKGPFASEVVDPAQLDVVMPMCELPMPVSEVLKGVDAYVVTHLHPDHFDMAADGTLGAKLDKTVPLFVQNEDELAKMKVSGFTSARTFSAQGTVFRGVTLRRTYAKHGTKVPCGPASGVFLSSPADKKTLWIMGDTVWCDETAKEMAMLKPDIVVLNTCAARFKTFGRLIMDGADVESVCRAAPNATVIASHMDTVAHASLTRKTLKAALERRGLAARVLLPDDGESYVF